MKGHTIKELTLMQCVDIARKLTARYARTHRGKNTLERKCIEKGYLVCRRGEINPEFDSPEKLGLFYLGRPITIRSIKSRNHFILMR